jgi:hypothetical protein
VNANAHDLDLVLTEADWYILRHFREFLMPFYAATNVLSGVYNPTSCLVIDYIWLIAESFSKHKSLIQYLIYIALQLFWILVRNLMVYKLPWE